jgi:transposase
MSNHVKKLSLTTDEKDFLMQLLHQRTLETRKYLRSRILLLKDEGLSNEKIADKLDVNVSTVRLCIEKYECGGIENAL